MSTSGDGGRWRRVAAALLGAAAVATAGCAVGPDFVAPRPPGAEAYTAHRLPSATVAADGRAQGLDLGAVVPREWWRLFECPALAPLIDEAIAANPSLQAAQATLRQSADQLRAGYGVFWPQIGASASAARERSFVPAANASRTTFNVFTVAGNVGYVLDVFGGERRAVEGLGADVDFQRYETAATYLTLVGNIVNAVIADAAYAAEIRATRQLVAHERDQVQITETQARAGTAPYVNVLTLEAQLDAAEAQLPPLRQKRAETRHLLAALLGREPAASAPPRVRLAAIALPTDLPVVLPSELVRQRPDILAAEAALHRASADIGVATAAMFPQISLSGGYGSDAVSTATLFSGPAAAWFIAAQAATPVFRGGTLWFQRRAAIDAYQHALASYRQTVLGGLVQVADTLTALGHDAAELDVQLRRETAAREAAHLTDVNYRSGIATYLELLVANAQLNQAAIARIGGQAQRLQDTVALLVALGGGWRTDAVGVRDPSHGAIDGTPS